MKRYYRKRYLLLALGVGYLVFSHSCMTMRTSSKGTIAFFKGKKVPYKDSTICIQDREIHYIQTGNSAAHTLVFLHGSPGSWDAYKEYLSDTVLSENFRIIAPDRPGFGKSGFRKSMDLFAQADILNEFFSKLHNGKPYTLIGHSYGGPLVVQMALKDPLLYENLVILAGALDPNAEKPEKWRKPLTWFPIKHLVPGALKPSNDELWLLKKDLKDLAPQLGQLTQNVLIIHGTNDKLVPFQNVAYMQNTFTRTKSLEVISIENERHFIVWDREELVKTSILKMLSN